VAYLHYLEADSSNQGSFVPVLLEIEFQLSLDRERFLSELGRLSGQYPDWELEDMREDIERRHVTPIGETLFPGEWGNRNRHEHWARDMREC
jgi:hypothetical protein